MLGMPPRRALSVRAMRSITRNRATQLDTLDSGLPGICYASNPPHVIG